ncbi:MAG: heparan-alpha-glucosaminide N-acetyltransferase domain-containing protein [Desulfobacterales bacterium]|nr:heparan-alpha-glucosaminide N-acetyltransferase domain-containing protein [Desulfobacterales bacterium]
MATDTPAVSALDIFRGATIASMILVNNPGANVSYAPLEHAVASMAWTFTDTVFPFFLWIVGVAMTLSTARRVERGEDRTQLLLRVQAGRDYFFAGVSARPVSQHQLGHHPDSGRAATHRRLLFDRRHHLPVHEGARPDYRHCFA